jgi:hypothetical protein
VAFFNDVDGYAVSSQSELLATTDGGDSWALEDIGPMDSTKGLKSIKLLPDDRTVMILAGQFILRKEFPRTFSSVPVTRSASPRDAGVRIVSTPNPLAHHSTLHLYAAHGVLKKPIEVRIYDLLGNEVADVSEGLVMSGSDGGATAEFDRSGLASGMYVVVLRTAWGSGSELIVVE